MKYLDDVGNLGNQYSHDKRQSANLGIARVRSEGEGSTLRVEGFDAGGKMWRVWLPQIGGVGFTEVWTADFDANGRQDLLFAGHFPGNGRCIDGLDITLLLFDAQGRPVPWNMSTMLPDHSSFPYVPVIVRDLNGDHRAEFVMTDCERVDPPEGFGERRRVSGVYEAREARMVPLRDVDTQPYARIAGRIHGVGKMETTPPDNWPDPMAGFDATPLVYLTGILTREAGCGGIRLKVEGNRVVDGTDESCKLVDADRSIYSNGTTVRSWPSVIIESAEGREIFLNRTWEGLRRVLVAGYPLRKLGTDSEHPWLWAEAVNDSKPARLVSRLVMTGLARKKFQNHAAVPAASGYDVLVIRAGACLALKVRSGAAQALPCGASSAAARQFERLRTAGIREGSIRGGDESRVWQILPREHSVKFLRQDDLGELGPITLESPGKGAELVNAAELAEGFLAEWQENGRRWLSFHDGEGALLAPDLGPPPGGDLLSSDDFGVYFVRWVNNLPFEVNQVRASVEWSRDTRD
jgi:hypothetical protein